MTDEAKLTEATKRFLSAQDETMIVCPEYGCKNWSRDPDDVCGEHGEKVAEN